MKYKGKTFLCKRSYANFEVGNFYQVELEAHFFKNTHLFIDGCWFTTELGDGSLFPSLYTYFLNEQEERSIKLQVIELENRFGF